jgi:hypothetical protein
MKREYRLYLNNADAYAGAEDEASAYRLLVQRVETIIAEEQQLFWQAQAKGGQNKPRLGPSRNHRNGLSKAHDCHLQRRDDHARIGPTPVQPVSPVPPASGNRKEPVKSPADP